MKVARSIELLSPAKNVRCGMEAVNHGADAVYIGAPQFSARATAGNSIQDIERLIRYAHPYNVKVYVALNTILKDEEIELAAELTRRLYDVGADALIVQDMALTEIDSPLPLHASTQMDNRSVEKVRFLEEAGFSQVVLARELSLIQIREMAEQTTIPLEVFVHGALCVSYSGQCYLSQALSGRSANRGECAQHCRLPYTLQDATGRTLAANKHLLSLKDMNRSDYLEELLDAGVSSLKIEGRLKEMPYVKNATAYYRKKLDELFLRRSDYRAASSGTCSFRFTPDVRKAFNRRFTDYFLKGRSSEITSFDTPKYIGEEIGRVKEIGRKSVSVSGSATLHNGDGFSFFSERSGFQGFRANRVEKNTIYPAEMPDIRLNALLYRNHDSVFERQLAQKTAERKVGVDLILRDIPLGFELSAEDEDGITASVSVEWQKERAEKDQLESIRHQLSRWGNTIFEVQDIAVSFQASWFLPASVLSALRRQLVERLLLERQSAYRRPLRRKKKEGSSYPLTSLTYLANVANSLARQAYGKYGVKRVDEAFEIKPLAHVPLMFTKHCLKYSLGYCPKASFMKRTPIKEPLYLLSSHGRLELEFDCKECEMRVYKSL